MIIKNVCTGSRAINIKCSYTVCDKTFTVIFEFQEYTSSILFKSEHSATYLMDVALLDCSVNRSERPGAS